MKQGKTVKGRGRSAQELLGVSSFSKYGLVTGREEILFFQVTPVNISVLSSANMEDRIQRLMELLSTYPELEICCTDAADTFDENKIFLRQRLAEEQNEKVRDLLDRDRRYLEEEMLGELAAARQFVIIARCRNKKPDQVIAYADDIGKAISGRGFDACRMDKAQIKRFIAVFLGTSVRGETIPDVDGGQFIGEM